MDNELKELYVKGSIVGMLIGDAMGYHYRFAKDKGVPQLSDIDMLPGPQEFRQEGIYTNASALALCTQATLNEYDSLNIDDLLERFYECMVGGYMNYDAEDYYLGQVSAQSIKNFSNGIPWDRCGLKTELADTDDDVFLRLLPVALWNISAETKDFLEEIRKTAVLTHASTNAIICSQLYALIVRNLLLQKAEKVFDTLADYYSKDATEFESALKEIRLQIDEPKTALVATFWAAWKVFSNNQNNFRNAVRKAMRCPNPNVVGGIVGSWVALQTGLNDIPLPWLKALKLSGEAMESTHSFVQRIVTKY